MWKRRDLREKITITRTTAGEEADSKSNCSHKGLFDELVLQLLILLRGGLDGDSLMCWQNLQYLACHVCSLIQFLTSSLISFFFL